MESDLIREEARKKWIAQNPKDQICCFLMTVGSDEQGKIRISIYNLCLEAAVVFDNMTEVILFMDKLMDRMELSSESDEMRQFVPAKDRKKGEYGRKQWKPEICRKVSKSDSVFYIRVFYRKNNSWQGEVRWKEGKKKKHFRSVLELLHLIQSAREEALEHYCHRGTCEQ